MHIQDTRTEGYQKEVPCAGVSQERSSSVCIKSRIDGSKQHLPNIAILHRFCVHNVPSIISDTLQQDEELQLTDSCH